MCRVARLSPGNCWPKRSKGKLNFTASCIRPIAMLIRVCQVIWWSQYYFTEHEQSPTTWIIRSINGCFLFFLISATLNPRFSQISRNMPTVNAGSLLACTMLQMFRERATIWCVKATSFWTTAWSSECRLSASTAFWSSSSLSDSPCCIGEDFLILAVSREKNPDICWGERASFPTKRRASDSPLTLRMSFDTSLGSAFFPRSSPMTNCSVRYFFCSCVNCALLLA